MTWKGWAALAAIVAIAAFFFGRSSVPAGISPADAAQLARRAGDSAIASYSKPIAQVIGRLTDSIAFYKGTGEAGAKIVVSHQTIAVHDQAPVQTSATPSETATRDTVSIPMRAIDSAGVQIAETLTVSPRPSLVQRAIWFTLEPDTILVALLKTKEGLQRFTAAGTAAGLKVTVADAAATPTRSRSSGARTVLTFVTVGGCTLLGVELGKQNTSAPLAIGGGALCAAGGLLSLRF